MGIIDYIMENHDPKQAKDNLTEDEFDKYLKEVFKRGKPVKYFWYDGHHYRRKDDGRFEVYDPEDEQ